MIELHAVAQHVAHHQPRAPQVSPERILNAPRIGKTHIGARQYLAAQLGTALIGGIETQLDASRHNRRKGIHQVAAIVAQPGTVSHDALGIISYNDIVQNGDFLFRLAKLIIFFYSPAIARKLFAAVELTIQLPHHVEHACLYKPRGVEEVDAIGTRCHRLTSFLHNIGLACPNYKQP